MASSPVDRDKDASLPVLKRIARKLAPWYGGVITIYATVHAIYGWVSGAGLLKTSFRDLMFNICLMAGLIALCAAIIAAGMACAGYVLASLVGPERFAIRAAWIFAIVAAVATSGFLFFVFVTDSRSFTEPPKYDDRAQWFVAALGAMVMVATYALFGKKLVDQFKGIKAELEDQS